MQEMRRSVGSEGEGRSIRSRLYSRTGMLCCIVALSMLPALPRDEHRSRKTMVIDPGTSTPETVTLAPSELALPETPDASAGANPQGGGGSRGGLFVCMGRGRWSSLEVEYP